jgi:hypothetical protein
MVLGLMSLEDWLESTVRAARTFQLSTPDPPCDQIKAKLLHNPNL